MDQIIDDNKPILPKLLLSGIDSLYISHYMIISYTPDASGLELAENEV